MSRISKWFGLFGFISAAMGCNSEEPVVEREDQFVIAVVQYLVVEQKEDLSGAAGQDVACISVWTGKEKDPSPLVLRRFHDQEPPIRPRSECQETGEEPILSYMVHIPTGEGATWYEIDMHSAKYQDGDAQLQVSYHKSAMSAGHWNCHLEYTDSGWVVEQCEGTATS